MSKKKDESKTAHAEQEAQDAQSVAAAETPDTQPAAGAEVEGPCDGEGLEAVTVVIIARNEKHGELAAMSVKKYLVGVDADVHVVTGENLRGTDAETLLEHLPHVRTERIILMTEGMLILNPVTIYEIGCRRGALTGNGTVVGENSTPKLMHKSVLKDMLETLLPDHPHLDPLLEYDEYARPKVAPVIMQRWSNDNWLMPVVSKDPSPEVLSLWASRQRFAFVLESSWTPAVVKYFEERFAE